MINYLTIIIIFHLLISFYSSQYLLIRRSTTLLMMRHKQSPLLLMIWWVPASLYCDDFIFPKSDFILELFTILGNNLFYSCELPRKRVHAGFVHEKCSLKVGSNMYFYFCFVLHVSLTLFWLYSRTEVLYDGLTLDTTLTHPSVCAGVGHFDSEHYLMIVRICWRFWWFFFCQNLCPTFQTFTSQTFPQYAASYQ